MSLWTEQKRAVKREWRQRKDEFRQRLREGRGIRPSGWSPWSREGERPRRAFGWRVWMLPVFLWPLMLDIPAEIILGRPHRLAGSIIGMGLAWMAAHPGAGVTDYPGR